MRQPVLARCLAALSLVASLTPVAGAQETKSARGTITAMAADTITVKAGERELKVMVDGKTTLIASGGSTATRKAAAAGTAGPRLSELLKVGDAVEVSYHEMAGSLHAASVRKISTAGSGGGSTSDERAETANGTVDTITATSLVISGSMSGGTFKQTFIIDGDTKVIGQGAGTAAAAKGGRIAIADYVTKGDRVTVSYHKMGATLHAAEVRVTQKPK